MSILKEMYERAKSETPIFWKKLRIFWAYVTAVAAIIVGLEASELDLLVKVMPKAVAMHVGEISKYAAAIGLISMLQTKFAIKNQNDIQ
jgi:hypothetical protein